MKLPRVPPHSLDMERGVKILTGTKHMKSKNARRNFQVLLHNEFHEREEKEKLRSSAGSEDLGEEGPSCRRTTTRQQP